jgi:hypothetical protein
MEELESDCGVHAEDISQEEWDAGRVQNPNELLMVSVRCEFVRDVIQSLRQTVWYLFDAGHRTVVASYWDL